MFLISIIMAITSFKIHGEKKTFYTFSDVCKKMDVKNLLIVNRIDENFIDCMGKVIDINHFCKLQLPSKVVKGEVFNDKVICFQGESAILVTDCIDSKCKDQNKDCMNLKDRYAIGLSLNYASLTYDKDDELLNCYYDSI